MKLTWIQQKPQASQKRRGGGLLTRSFADLSSNDEFPKTKRFYSNVTVEGAINAHFIKASNLSENQFEDENGTLNFIGRSVDISLSSGSYVFTNCCGTVSLERGQDIILHVNSSPNLKINGVTLDNWHNVYRDGLASYTYPINIVRTLDTIALNETISTEVGPAALRAEKRSLRFSIVKQSLASIGFDLDLVYSEEYNAYDGAVANNLSNGATGFPDWVSMSFALTNNGLRFMLRPYPAETNYSVYIYELYLEKREM